MLRLCPPAVKSGRAGRFSISAVACQASLEEDAVGFLAKLSEEARRRIRRIRGEREAEPRRRPADRRRVFHELAAEAGIGVPDTDNSRNRPAEAQLIGDVRWNRGTQLHGVGDIAVVPQIDVGDQRSLRRVEVDEQRIVVRQPRRPEDAIREKAGVEVVDLSRESCKVILTLVQVKSDEHEPRIEIAAVHASIGA
jgi:hypothetical protein